MLEHAQDRCSFDSSIWIDPKETQWGEIMIQGATNGPAELLFAVESSDTSEFQRRARTLQALWRKEQGYPMGDRKGRPMGSRLAMPWAQATLLNYLTDDIRRLVEKEVLDPEKSKGKVYGRPRIFNNLLSSQPMVFNLFGMLIGDRKLSNRVFSEMTEGRCHEITRFEFEHSPGRGDPRFTGDRSAFDFYVEYKTPLEKLGFLGIEVKYHENLRSGTMRDNQRYRDLAQQMGCFLKEKIAFLEQSPLEQIWRDHLLAGSLLQGAEKFSEGRFVFLYPEDNQACAEAIGSYRGCLSNDSGFAAWTLESFYRALRRNSCEPWVELFYDRYLAFEKLGRFEDR